RAAGRGLGRRGAPVRRLPARAGARGGGGRPRRRGLRGGLRRVPSRPRALSVRWLLVKDLQILRRSPLLVALLVLYPVVVAVLIGLALSRGPERPKVAFVNEVPKGERLEIGGRRLDLLSTQAEVYDRIDPVPAASREQAIEKVRSGEALGAVVVPRDAVRKLESGFQRPTVEVFVNQEDPLKA